MTDVELADAFKALAVLSHNVIGFDHLAELEGESRLDGARRVMAEAQVYANGVELARQVILLGNELTRRLEG